ncbi:isoaspartyl peptidase/L-asparaginase family protein [Fodinibius sediminis]|uniref:L-asparaginase/N4-(Beta-N-acetylglucosaminyl)-L-asparaginase n=1 Tax=Fodinibius sediminis TaxID=1214077 RepID=A0A521EY97_9BACT|nr:N(4)-(beta-N-acetylglucosaminyl)-L-asparaginase [Fodinibius sediminis]SMO88889.1 L-asparaginase/N4-(beta-N-acetylglucosaminyl)-L-asparaginase [Fodinibius sediminis]
MISRKNFLKLTALGGLAPLQRWSAPPFSASGGVNKPLVISTWNHGLPANEAAWEVLSQQGRALDAVEAGVRIPEADPEVRTVGYGGYPDRDGFVTLDACIMDEQERCGSVAALQHIKHPISVARKVIEESPHVMLVGEGALQFALGQGFEKENLLTEASRNDWQEWKKDADYQPEINIENHDTIGMLALDSSGNLSGACTTSGAAWKMHGRVGDSPLIGAGLFVDNEVGAAAATGLGEEVIRTCGTHLVVENMRRGDDPETACRKAVQRIVEKNDSVEDIQVGFIAVNKKGEFGGYSIQQGFNFAVYESGNNRLIDAPNWAAS